MQQHQSCNIFSDWPVTLSARMDRWTSRTLEENLVVASISKRTFCRNWNKLRGMWHNWPRKHNGIWRSNQQLWWCCIHPKKPLPWSPRSDRKGRARLCCPSTNTWLCFLSCLFGTYKFVNANLTWAECSEIVLRFSKTLSAGTTWQQMQRRYQCIRVITHAQLWLMLACIVISEKADNASLLGEASSSNDSWCPLWKCIEEFQKCIFFG